MLAAHLWRAPCVDGPLRCSYRCGDSRCARETVDPVFASSSTASSTLPPRAGSSSVPPPGSRPTPSSRCRCAGGCCASSCAAACCRVMTHARWGNGNTGGGSSVDGSVRIEPADRAGRERLLRFCARPPFALDRLRELDPEHLLYESTKPGPGGNGSRLLTPLEPLDRIAALVPPATPGQCCSPASMTEGSPFSGLRPATVRPGPPARARPRAPYLRPPESGPRRQWPAAPDPARTARPPRRAGAAAANSPSPLLRRPRSQRAAAHCGHRPRAGGNHRAARSHRGARRRTGPSSRRPLRLGAAARSRL